MGFLSGKYLTTVHHIPLFHNINQSYTLFSQLHNN